jgi:hypothetical protein
MKSMRLLVTVILFSAALFAGCINHTEEAKSLQKQIDSLRIRWNNSYKPGMGELMSNIQLHHSKLWFAGENKNWPLAEYNESLIQSAFKKIQLYHGDKPEAKAAFMIIPAMDSISKAISEKSKGSFERSFLLLTVTCNNCHTVTSHAFNVITIPKIPPVTDQDFREAVKQKITLK